MHESWNLKKGLSDRITTPQIDMIYESAQAAGAIGGKLIGAGGGGFILIFAKPEEQPKIKEKLKDLLFVPFTFESYGSQIVVYQPEKERIESRTFIPKPLVINTRERLEHKESLFSAQQALSITQ